MLSERELLAFGLELHEDNQTLMIADANEKHEGHYTCVISNPAGSTEETFFVLVLGKFCNSFVLYVLHVTKSL